jgi:hypothetical protein
MGSTISFYFRGVTGNCTVSMEKAAELLASSEFQEKLVESMADPGGDVAKETLQSVTSIMVGMGKSVPFTAAERADVITSMYALMQRYGLSSSFLTIHYVLEGLLSFEWLDRTLGHEWLVLLEDLYYGTLNQHYSTA